MKSILKTLTLVFLSTQNLWAQAGGAGVRGGGEVANVYINRQVKKELYDLVSPYTCDWKPGLAMIEKNPELNKVLNQIAKLDWYLAHHLYKEIKNLEFCNTKTLLPILKRVYPSPEDNLVRERAAFRLNYEVWWDVDLANSLSARSRAFLFIHEALHTWMNSKTSIDFYYQNLWSTVVTLNKVAAGMINNVNDLYYQLNRNQMTFPLAVNYIDPQTRAVLQFLSASESERALQILKSTSPETLIAIQLPLQPKLRSALLYDDVLKLDSQLLRETGLSNSIQNIMINGTLKDFKELLNKTFKRINPMTLALTIYDSLSPDKQKELSPNIENHFSEAIGILNSADVSEQTFQGVRSLVVNEAFTKLTDLNSVRSPFYLRNMIPFRLKTDIAKLMPTKSESLDVQIIRLHHPSSIDIGVPGNQNLGAKPDAAVSAELMLLTQLTVHMIQSEQGDKIIRLIKLNANFKNIFTAEKWISKIEVSLPTIEREKVLGIQIARQTAERAYLKYLEMIKQQVSPSQYVWFTQLIEDGK